jgi:hypothetical protein
MFILEKKHIAKKSLFTRFYRYDDIERGLGDTGTVKYANISIDNFDIKQKKGFGDNIYYLATLKKEAGDLIFPENKHWGYGIGYRLATEAEREQEIIRAKYQLKAAEEVIEL